MVTRLLTLAAVLILVIGAVYLGASQSTNDASDEGSAAATPIVPISTATITRRTIESTEEFEGTLGYAGEGVIIAGLNGTYTKLPEEGAVLTLGDEIYEVDGTSSSFLMYGKRPAYRPLDIDSSNGPDIRQLEASLKKIGFPNILGRRFQPDWNFRQKTEDAVEQWQKRTGQERDGRVEFGEVTFLPDDVRVTQVVPELGTRAQAGQVLAYTSDTDLVVTLDLEADRRDILAVGDEVSVELPDGTEAVGRVKDIASVAETLPGASEPSVEVTIELEDTAVVGDLDGAEVTVSIVRETRPNVLTVPVDALLALREGGYALEMVADDGSTYLTLAEVGLFDDRGVEVSGNFDAGDTVVVPA
jgi:peptidoglycan hydrolase-like protein with peptidoglycan-binding domain